MDNQTMDNDYYSDGDVKPKSRVGKVFRYVGLALIVLVYGLIMFRIFIKSDPKEAKSFIWTDKSVAAYENNKDGFDVFSQKIRTYQRQIGEDENGIPQYETVTYNDITSDGTFRVSNMIYVRTTKELIVTVRYNRTAVEALKEVYGFETVPQGELFFFALDGVGKSGDAYATDYSYTSFSKFTYEYRRLVFSDVELPEKSTLYLNVYYVGDVRLDSPLEFYPDKKEKGLSVRLTLPIYDPYIGGDKYKIEKALPPAENDRLKKAPYVILK